MPKEIKNCGRQGNEQVIDGTLERFSFRSDTQKAQTLNELREKAKTEKKRLVTDEGIEDYRRAF